MEKLECFFCRRKYPLNLFDPFCPVCHELMLISCPSRKQTFRFEPSSSLERFLDFLPLARVNRDLSLGEGNTPLVKLNRLAEKLNLYNLFAKNEFMNPTGSFKDRGTAVVVQKAYSLGIEKVGTVSTGNMASSTAAYGAKAGFETYIFLKEGSSAEKVMSTGVHGARLFKVKGDYGKLFRESLALGKKYGIYFANSVDPFRIEGYKITSFEIFVQMENQLPRFIFVPVSSAGHLIGLMKAFMELKQQRIIDRLPVFVGVQARGCSPLARAFARNLPKFIRVFRAETVAHAISNPSPPGGNLALKWIRENGGMIIDVTDKQILKAQKEMAELEGIFCDPASATTLAGLKKLSRSRGLRSHDKTVLVITGSGLKSMETLRYHQIPVFSTSLTRLEKTLRSHL